jgi:hypothetical protein
VPRANGVWVEPVPALASVYAPAAALSYCELFEVELPPARPLVEGLIEEGTGAILGGEPGVGKTWLVLSLARAVGSGTAWLGRFPTNQVPVLIVDEESHLPGLQARVRMLEAGDPLDVVPEIYFAVGHGVRLDADPGAAHLEALIDRHKPGLVILDSFTRIHGADENSAGEMAGVFGNAKAVMRRHGTGILFTDHVRKHGLLNSPDETLRGSTEKRAWPECILMAEPSGGNAITVRHIKARFTERIPDFTVEVRVDGAAGTAAVVHAGAAVPAAEAKANDLIAAIHALQKELGEDGADATKIAAWLECSPDTVRRHADKLVAAGILRTRKVATGRAPKVVYEVQGGRG